MIRGSQFGEGWAVLPLHGVLTRSLGWPHSPVAGLGWKALGVPLTGLALQVAVLSTGSLGSPHSMVALASGGLSEGVFQAERAGALKAWPLKSHGVTSAFCRSDRATGQLGFRAGEVDFTSS